MEEEGRTVGERELSVWIREVRERKVVSSEVDNVVARAYLRRIASVQRRIRVKGMTNAFSRSFSASPLFPLHPLLVPLCSTNPPICSS